MKWVPGDSGKFRVKFGVVLEYGPTSIKVAIQHFFLDGNGEIRRILNHFFDQNLWLKRY